MARRQKTLVGIKSHLLIHLLFVYFGCGAIWCGALVPTHAEVFKEQRYRGWGGFLLSPSKQDFIFWKHRLVHSG